MTNTLTQLKHSSIAILGFGREGISSLEFLRTHFPHKEIGIADRTPRKELPQEATQVIAEDSAVRCHCGEGYLNALSSYDYIIRSPGIPPQRAQSHARSDATITSQTQLFLELFPGRVIGITGTKGKGTTAALLHHILSTADIHSVLGGNIGVPPLGIINAADDTQTAVMEFSSHQLADVAQSPSVAVLLGIFPEHADYYATFDDYKDAKARITQYQTSSDTLFYDASNPHATSIADDSPAEAVAIDPDIVSAYLPSRALEHLGTIYRVNCAAAIQAAKYTGVSESIISKALETYRPLSHRLEKVGTYKGITFYNDSAATAPPATIGAIDALEEEIESLILGGFDRGLDFTALAKKIWEVHITVLILFPESGRRIWEALEAQKPAGREMPHTFLVHSMEDAVSLALQHTPRGGACVLSPASPSFGLFNTYEERGNIFKEALQHVQD